LTMLMKIRSDVICPHRCYNPDDVRRVIAQLTADYQRIDPAGLLTAVRGTEPTAVATQAFGALLLLGLLAAPASGSPPGRTSRSRCPRHCRPRPR
jgi:hypothetical protein